jgi:hypothetical protein
VETARETPERPPSFLEASREEQDLLLREAMQRALEDCLDAIHEAALAWAKGLDSD